MSIQVNEQQQTTLTLTNKQTNINEQTDTWQWSNTLCVHSRCQCYIITPSRNTHTHTHTRCRFQVSWIQLDHLRFWVTVDGVYVYAAYIIIADTSITYWMTSIGWLIIGENWSQSSSVKQKSVDQTESFFICFDHLLSHTPPPAQRFLEYLQYKTK